MWPCQSVGTGGGCGEEAGALCLSLFAIRCQVSIHKPERPRPVANTPPVPTDYQVRLSKFFKPQIFLPAL